MSVDAPAFQLTVGAQRGVRATVQGTGSFNAAVTWASDRPGVAGVDGQGQVSAVAPGTATITATSVQDPARSAALTVTVVAPPAPPAVPGPVAPTVSGVSLSHTALTLTAGGSQPVTATVEGTGVFNPAVTWVTSDPGVAGVDAAGRVTAVAPGTATVTAISVGDPGRRASLSVTVTAKAPTVTGVTLSPTELSLTTGGSQVVTAAVQGTGTFNPAVTWSSSQAGVASVDAAGRVTAVTPGQATITATSVGDPSRRASLTVTVSAPAPTVSGVTLSPASLTLTAGTGQAVTATVQGTGSFDRTVTWFTSNPAVAGVDGSGQVSAVAPGGATVTAVSVGDPSRRATLSVTVVAAPPPPTPQPPAPQPPAPGADPFAITVVFPDGTLLTPAQKDAFTGAAARWSQVIAAGLPDVAGVQLSTGARVTVDDLTIVASSVPIDGPGNVLGQAGPRQVRPGTTLPLWGEMQFDSADLAGMEANGTLTGVILHEMGHVLGIGTLWNRYLTGNADSCAAATQVQYTGAAGLREYRTLGGLAPAVPVEDRYGEGTKCGHWKKSVFGAELMTGFVSRGQMPLSRLTLGALADLGYSVNYAAADAYALANVAAQGLEAFPIVERLITPDGVLDGPLHQH
ncbi:Ig-like domain-containing protein [Deinococcus sp. NW-56]|uniref:Ig-like domain-containing protein n=1 Tax=Deinococcus sp. NW-56 TaxID=2080419 RepID=UPI000CF41B6A|nr:Ig-like domain-containing protein [Deinococcus sp. NW-56]